MSHTIAITAHTSREEHARQLAKTVRAAKVSMDTGKLGCEGNHQAVWSWHRDNTTTQWAVLLEDDAQPVDHFTKQLRKALTAAPTDIVSLYLGQQLPHRWQPVIAAATEQADQQNAHWITTTDAIHGVGLAIRTELLPELLKHWTTYRAADKTVGWWAEKTNRTIAYTWPSLVNHLDLPTLIKLHRDGMPRPQGRTAWRVGTHNEWNSNTVTMTDPFVGRRTRKRPA